MIQRLIIFLIRIRLGLKVNECFQFTNQKSNAVYFFTRTGLTKCWRGLYVESGISLNWLLNPECKSMLIRRRDIFVADGVIRYTPGIDVK
jgi:hypothetical protein